MTQPAMKVPNGIIDSEEKKALCCCLCDDESSSSNSWLEHITTGTHARILRSFDATFVNQSQTFHCKKCSKNFDWKTLKSHAAEHKISPWYRPDDLYKIFFENQIMEWFAKFYCFPCDEIFLNWSDAFVHTNAEIHKNQLVAKEPKNKSLNLLGTGLYYEWLVCDGMFGWYDEKICCKICDFHSCDIANFDVHIEGPRHNRERLKLIVILKERVHDKVANERSMINDRVTLIKNEIYWCNYCQCLVDGMEQVSFHVSQHESARWRLSSVKQPITDELTKNPLDGASSELKSKSHDYMIENGDEKLRCTICNNRIIERTDIKAHVTSDKHATGWKKFRDNAITFEGLNKYYCDFCECYILGIGNVYLHINGSRHEYWRFDENATNNLEESSNSKNQSIDGASAKVSNGVVIDEKFLSPELIVKHSDVDYYCAACDFAIIDSVNVQDHITSKKHVKERNEFSDDKILFADDQYYCVFCDCKIYRLDAVSRHIDGQKHITAKSESQESTDSLDFVKYTVAKRKKFPYRYIVESEEATHAICKICECSISGYANIEQHVAGYPHECALRTFNDNKIEFIEKDTYYCNYCNCDIYSNWNVHRHIEGTRHRNSVYETKERSKDSGNCVSAPKDLNPAVPKTKDTRPKDSKEPKPEIQKPKDENLKDPNVEIPESINQDLNNPKDPKSVLPNPENLKPKYPKNPNNPFAALFNAPFLGTNGSGQKSAKPQKQELPYNYIVELTENNFYCKICDCSIDNYVNIEDHISGYCHYRASRQFNENGIEFMKNNVYHCKYCNCELNDNITIHEHIKGDQHVSALQELTDLKTNDSKFKINNTDLMIIKQNQIPNLTKPIKCGICNFKCANFEELHSHSAGHFCKDFLGLNDDKSDNNDNNDDFSSSDNKSSMTSLNSSTESIYTLASEGENFNWSETTDGRLKKYTKLGKLEGKTKKLNMKRIAKILNFRNNDIYDMSDKLRELELGTKLSYAKFNGKIYCLVCRIMTEFTRENYLEHLCNLNHCIYLETMERDHASFHKFSAQFSEIDLGLQYIEEISKDLVLCHVCEIIIGANDDVLKKHIDEKSHARETRRLRDLAMMNFEMIKLSIKCDWYKVAIYRCVPCLLTFRSEVTFYEHMSSNDHLYIMEKPVNKKLQLVYDFCEACALLWYGYRRTCAYHREIDTHLWLIRDGYYLSEELPLSAKELLSVTEFYINETMRIYKSSLEEEREKEIVLIGDMEMAVGQKYSRAKAYMFGSRVTGMGSFDCDIDVFLDCGDMYNGKMKSRDEILNIMDEVCECLDQELKTWIVEELVKTCRSPIIRAHHKPTGLSCDISFENGLAVENTILINSYNDAFPLCREMIIFLKGWLTLCKLSGTDGITSYALYWHVIFFLQQESILPSVEELIKIKNQSRTIDGWEVGATRDFTHKLAKCNFTVRQLLMRFFDFWSKFDHRYDVACPMIGKILKKRVFLDYTIISDDESLYIDHVKKSMVREELRIDSPMCLQDPFDLRHNITKAVGKVLVNRFRKYCSYSLDALIQEENQDC